MISAPIVVLGGTKEQRALVKRAAAFYLKQLLKPRINFLEVECIQIKLVRDLFKKEEVKGDCTYEGDPDDPILFELRLDASMNMSGVLRALAHEMVHVWQYITGDLQETSEGWNIARWQGQRINWEKMDYYEQPWEIEAYGKEYALFEKFVTKNKLSRSKWYVRDSDYL